MLTAVVTQTGEAITVQLVQTVPPTTSEEETSTTEATEGEATHDVNVKETDEGLVAKSGVAHVPVSEANPGPSPIVPELNELVWSSSAFIVFAVAMRYFLFPMLKRGMDARYAHIRNDHETADRTRTSAQLEVSEYQAQLATVKAEAAAIIDEARQELEATAAAKLVTLNETIAQKHADANAENEAARAAVRDQIESAVIDVASSAIQHAVGKAPNPDKVQRVVSDLMSAGAVR